MSVDIAYIISHGFAARMVTQTNLMGQLVERGLRVALITPDAEDDNLVAYCEKQGVKLYSFNPASSFWTTGYGEARRYFLEDIRNNTALWEKHLSAIRPNSSNGKGKQLRIRLLYIAHLLTQRFPKLKNWYQKRESKYLKSGEANKFIQQIDPQLLIATYPVSFKEAMLLRAAQQQQKATAIHLLSWDNISCKGHFPALADRYIAWGEIMKAEFMEYYNIEAKQIHALGVPHFDLHLQSRQQPQHRNYLTELNLNPDKPYLLFGMSSPRFAPKEIDIVEWLAAQIQEDIFGSDMQLVVRPHPQNVQGNMSDQSWLPRLQAINKGKVAVDFPNLVESKLPWSMQMKDMYRLSNLLAGSVVNINSGSTLSIDALMCDTPVILTSFDGSAELNYWESARRLIDYPHLKKLVALGGVEVVESFEQLNKQINKFIQNRDANKTMRAQTIRQQCANYDLPCTSSIADLLTSWISKTVLANQ